MDKFEQYKINIWEKEKNLILEYLDKIKKFISNNNIDKELFLDIEEMVFEKLALENEINELKIRKIIKEVWQPEIIFSDYVDAKKTTSTKKEEKLWTQENFYEKLIENWWIRDNDWAILLWISKTLSEKIWISILAVRVLLILICFFGWLSAWLYVLAWLILPVKWVDYSWKTILWYVWNQIILLIRNLVYNFSAFLIKSIWFIFSKLIMILKIVFSFIVNNIFPIIRFVIFWFLAFLISIFLFSLLIIWAAYFSNFSIENIDFVWVLPWYFLWWIWFWIISASILTIASFLYWVNKKILNYYILSLAWISFILAVFLSISTWFDLAQKYSFKRDFTKISQIELTNTWNYIVDLSSLEKSIFFNLWWHWEIKVFNSTWSLLKVEIKTIIHANDDIYNKIISWISNINLENTDNTIKLNFENNKVLNKKVPVAPYKNEINIYVPTWIKLSLKKSIYYFWNAYINSGFEKYWDFLENSCYNSEIWYSSEQKKFICDPSEDELKYAKEEYLKRYVMENFDEISTIKHLNKYKRNYYGNYWVKSDWSFDNLYFWNDDKILNIEFSDSSLDIDAQVWVEDTASWVTFKDFTIKDVEANYAYKEIYYEDITAIKDYLNEEEVTPWNY